MARTVPSEELTIRDKRDVIGYLKSRRASDPDEIYYMTRDLIQVNNKGMVPLSISALIGFACFALSIYYSNDRLMTLLLTSIYSYMFQLAGLVSSIIICIKIKRSDMIKQAKNDYMANKEESQRK